MALTPRRPGIHGRDELVQILVRETLMKGLNPNCPDLDIAETCEVDCEIDHLQCLTSCENQDSSCISTCTRDFAACVDICPCYTDCPNGCPCPSLSDYCPVSGVDFNIRLLLGELPKRCWKLVFGLANDPLTMAPLMSYVE